MSTKRSARRWIIAVAIVVLGTSNAVMRHSTQRESTLSQGTEPHPSITTERIHRADSILVRLLRVSGRVIKEFQRFFNHEE